MEFPALVIDGEEYAIISKKDWYVEEIQNAWFIKRRQTPAWVPGGIMQAPRKEGE